MAFGDTRGQRCHRETEAPRGETLFLLSEPPLHRVLLVLAVMTPRSEPGPGRTLLGKAHPTGGIARWGPSPLNAFNLRHLLPLLAALWHPFQNSRMTEQPGPVPSPLPGGLAGELGTLSGSPPSSKGAYPLGSRPSTPWPRGASARPPSLTWEPPSPRAPGYPTGRSSASCEPSATVQSPGSKCAPARALGPLERGNEGAQTRRGARGLFPCALHPPGILEPECVRTHRPCRGQALGPHRARAPSLPPPPQPGPFPKCP